MSKGISSHILLALFDEALQTLTAVGSRRFTPEAKSDRCEHCTFTASILPNNEVDEGPQVHSKVVMTHEIIAFNTLKNPMLRGHIFLVIGR